VELHAEDVVVRHGEHLALAGVSLHLRPGERVLLTGPAGSGKTTLLKVLAGLVRPQSGQVLWDRDEVYRLPAPERKRRQAGLGMVFQTDALFDSMSVLDNVLLPLLRRGVRREEALTRAQAALEAVRLSDAASRSPELLSGGMRKRAGLARAVVAEPQVLLADDPLAGLDPATALQVAELLLGTSRNRTLVVCAPDPLPELPLPRQVVLEAGKLRYDGPALPDGPPGAPA